MLIRVMHLVMNTNYHILHKCTLCSDLWFNTLRTRQNGRHFPDDTFKCIFLNENVWISIKISLKFVLKGAINNIPALVQIMAWRRPGDKPLSEPMMVSLPTHKCVTRPQWVDSHIYCLFSIRRGSAGVVLVKYQNQFWRNIWICCVIYVTMFSICVGVICET